MTDGNTDAADLFLRQDLYGTWTDMVRATDYDALAAKLAKVTADHARVVDKWAECLNALDETTAALKTARRDALEEAAVFIENNQTVMFTSRASDFVQTRRRTVRELAKMLRALIEKETKP